MMPTQNYKVTDNDPLIKSQSQSITISQHDDITITEDKEARNKKNRSAVFRQIRMFLLMIVIDVGLPLALYYILKQYISELLALIISGIPPLLHVIINFILKRRIEVIGCICIFSFVMSAVLTLISGNARLALLRDSTTTAVIALAFLVTLIPLRTPWFKLYPLTFLVAQQIMSDVPVEWVDIDGNQQSMSPPEFYWTHAHIFRRHAYIWTAVWGVSLMAEFIIKVIMIEATTLTIDQIVLYGFIVVIVIFVTIGITSTWSTVLLRRKCIVFYDEWVKVNDYSHQFNKRTTGDDNSV